jgi:hypothetical protein
MTLCDAILAFMEAVQNSQRHIGARCNTTKFGTHMQGCSNNRPGGRTKRSGCACECIYQYLKGVMFQGGNESQTE